jgi:hypothetical protein
MGALDHGLEDARDANPHTRPIAIILGPEVQAPEMETDTRPQKNEAESGVSMGDKV